MITEREWVERLYDVRCEPDKLIIMIMNRRQALRRVPTPKPEVRSCEWGPWLATERIDKQTHTEAAVWGSDGDMVCMVYGGYEGCEYVEAIDRAKAIAAMWPEPAAPSAGEDAHG